MVGVTFPMPQGPPSLRYWTDLIFLIFNAPRARIETKNEQKIKLQNIFFSNFHICARTEPVSVLPFTKPSFHRTIEF